MVALYAILLSLLFVIIGYSFGSILFAPLVGKKFLNIDIRSSGSKNPGSTNLTRVSKSKKWGILTTCLDCLKGYVAIVLCTLIYFLINRYAFLGTMDFAYIVYLAGFFAIVGHCYPIQYFCALAKYKTINEQVKEKSGGKGVAATGGLAFAFNPWLGFLCILTWLIVLKITKYVSISSMIGTFCMALFVLIPGIHNLTYIYQWASLTPYETLWITYGLIPGTLANYYSDYHTWVVFVIYLLPGMLVTYKHKENIKRLKNGTESKTK